MGGASGYPARRRREELGWTTSSTGSHESWPTRLPPQSLKNPQVEACREKARAAGFEMKADARSRRRVREPFAGRPRLHEGRRRRLRAAASRSAAPERSKSPPTIDGSYASLPRIAADETAEPGRVGRPLRQRETRNRRAPARVSGRPYFVFWDCACWPPPARPRARAAAGSPR